MNKANVLGLVIGLVLSSSAFAAADKHPCQAIKKACQSGGFEKGKHKEGKGLWKDCVEKIKNGETVSGVTINQEDVVACKAKVAAKKESK